MRISDWSSDVCSSDLEPFGVLIGDYEVQHLRDADHPTDDVAALKAFSSVAAAAFAPFVVGCAPRMFSLESFSELGLPIDLQTVFRPIGRASCRERGCQTV